jgi:hypothetical protein
VVTEVIGRTLYVLGYHNEKVGGENVGQKRLHLWAINVDTGAITRLPDPPNSVGTTFRNSDAQDIVFDTKNRRVVFPYTPNHCGAIEGMYTYDIATQAWTSHSTTPFTSVPGNYVRGNTVVYDPVNDVTIVGGSVACTDWGYPGLPNITHYFLWRN